MTGKALAIGIDDVRAAASRLAGHAHRTPVIRSRSLDARVGAQVYLKCESFQRAGAFKFRGAWNALSQLAPEAARRGVITFSSGNHGQACALAGRLLEIPVTVVMPANAPLVKREAVAAYGARTVFCDPADGSREAVTSELAAGGGLTIIPPFDHPHVMAGQGTAALELLEDVSGLDALLVPVGGGGLISGCATAAKALRPRCRVVGIEPAGADDGAQSFRSARLVRIAQPRTVADGVRTPSLGQLTFPVIRERVDDFCLVSEEAIAAAVIYLFTRTKLVVEPSGALGVAALLEGRLRVEGRLGVVISGGNLDPAGLAELLRLAHQAS